MTTEHIAFLNTEPCTTHRSQIHKADLPITLLLFCSEMSACLEIDTKYQSRAAAGNPGDFFFTTPFHKRMWKSVSNANGCNYLFVYSI